MLKDIKDYFVKPSDPILKKIAKKIPLEKISSPEMQKIINKMLSVAYMGVV